MKGTYHDSVLAKITERFDCPVIENSWRGQYVETLVAALVGDPWRETGKDWGGHDLEHSDGTRVQIKQSAARQSWAPDVVGKTPRFGIAAATGYYVGPTWVAEPGRRAHLYIFAWHDGQAAESDQRDELQWRFCVLPSAKLPASASIGLGGLKRCGAEWCDALQLGDMLDVARRVFGAGNADARTG